MVLRPVADAHGRPAVWCVGSDLDTDAAPGNGVAAGTQDPAVRTGCDGAGDCHRWNRFPFDHDDGDRISGAGGHLYVPSIACVAADVSDQPSWQRTGAQFYWTLQQWDVRGS